MNNKNKELIAIDGKVARNSFDKYYNKEPLYLVNAWANKNKLVLGQFKTLGKGHDIAGIKNLLELLDIKKQYCLHRCHWLSKRNRITSN